MFAGKIFRRGSKETAERNAEKGIYGSDLWTVGPLMERHWAGIDGASRNSD